MAIKFEVEALGTTEIWMLDSSIGSPPLELPLYLKDRIESRKRKIWDCKSDALTLAEAKRKAIIENRVRRLSDQTEHVKKTVQENQLQQKYEAEKSILRINERLKKAECKRSKRLNSISSRCRQKVIEAKAKREQNIRRQIEQKKAQLEAINGKLAAGIARRNYLIRIRQLRTCRWCAARKIQQWWRVTMLTRKMREFLVVCPKEIIGSREPNSYYDLRRLLISRRNIRTCQALLEKIYRFNSCWDRGNAGARILLTAFMIKYFPRSVLAYDGHLEQNLMKNGEELVTKFRNLISSHCTSYKRLHERVLEFGRAWSRYVKSLDDWKKVDSDRLIGELHQYWANLQAFSGAADRTICCYIIIEIRK